MSVVNGGTIVVRVSGQDIGLTTLLQKIQQQMAATGVAARRYATDIKATDADIKRSDSEKARYAITLARVASAMGDTAGATRILTQTLQQLTPSTQAAANVQLELQKNLNSASSAAQSQVSGINLLKSALGALGVSFAVSSVINFSKQAIEEGNALEKLTTTFRVLSGSQDAYQQNLAVARDQQDKYGGSLQDTIEGLSSFANLSKRTGVNLQELTNLARALAIVDPVQGFKGAGIAIKELFSGNITSLSRRFEIPRDVLNRINEITDNKEKFAALTQELEKFGISSELLSSQMGTTAVSFDKLTGSADDLKATVGQLFAELVKPIADRLTADIKTSIDALNLLKVALDTTGAAAEFNANVFTKTNSYDSYISKIREANSQLPPLAASIQELTPAQYALAQAFVATGSSVDQALSKVSAIAPEINNITAAFERTPGIVAQGAQAIQDYSNAALGVAATSAEGAVFVNSLSAEVLLGNISLQDGQVALTQWAQGAQIAAAQATGYANATTDLIDRQEKSKSALDELIITELKDNQTKEQAKIVTDGVRAVLAALTNGTITQANAEAILAGQYGVTASQMPGLINLTYQLAAARNAEIQANNKLNQASVQQKIDSDRAAGRQGRGDSSDAQEIEQAAARRNAEVQKALDAEIQKTGTAAQKRAFYNKQLAEANRLYGANSAEVIRARTELEAFDQSQQKAAKKGGSPKLTANEKLNNKLLADQDKFNNKFEDAELKHFDKLADIYEAFNKKQQEQFAKNEVSKRRSRADFYSGLQDAKGIDTAAFAASYEEAFQKAQEIAQSGKAVLANEFLELRQKQIEELKQLAEEEAKINADRKEGKITPQEAEGQLAFLAGRKKLIEDAQNEEQQLLLKKGDENQNQLNEQLTAEQEAYQNNTDKIITAADRAAEAKIKNAQRSKIAVSEENKALAEQNALYDKISSKTGGVVPPSITQGQNKATLPSEAAQDKPIDIQAVTPVPIVPTDILVIRQAEMFIVHDADVITSIGDMTTRLESRLVEITATLSAAKDSLVAAVGSVENAVRNIRVNNSNILAG